MMKFWPRNKDVPVLSESILNKLQLKDIIETKDEKRRILLNCWGGCAETDNQQKGL